MLRRRFTMQMWTVHVTQRIELVHRMKMSDPSRRHVDQWVVETSTGGDVWQWFDRRTGDPLSREYSDRHVATRERNKAIQSLLGTAKRRTLEESEVVMTPGGQITVTAGADIQTGDRVAIHDGVEIGVALHDAKAGDEVTIKM